MTTRQDIQRYRASLQDEIDSAWLYETLAEMETQEPLREVYRRLAKAETAHARFWEEHLRQAGQPDSTPQPSARARILGWLARRFGPQFVLPTLMGGERGASRGYHHQPETQGSRLPGEEQSHARLLRTIAGTHSTGLTGGALAQLEGRHRAASGNALRAAVLGASDGLLSNLSLVMGVAGANLPAQSILITGVAGLLAGASSMALGEWISVQSSRELYEHQMAIEREEIIAFPDEEAQELALIYQAKGIPAEQAQALAGRIISDEQTALDTLAREELGIEPEELGGSALEAAATSFFLFAVGAIVPVLPYLVTTGLVALLASLGLSAVGLFAIGAAITLLTGRSVLYSGMRQVLFGLAAAAVTFGVGRLIGVSIAG